MLISFEGISDRFYEAQKSSLEMQGKKQLDASKSIKKIKAKKHLRDSVEEVHELVNDSEKCPNTFYETYEFMNFTLNNLQQLKH